MLLYGPQPVRERTHSSRLRAFSTIPPVCLASMAFVLTAGSFATVAHADEDEVPFSEVRIILETNATDCDTGIQLFFDGDPWRYAEIEDPNERRVLRVAARGRLKGFGLTEQFNESNEPVMEELVAANPLGDCEEEAEDTLRSLFRRFPAGVYEFEGLTVEGDELESEATLSHLIPAPPAELEVGQDSPTAIAWELDDSPIEGLPASVDGIVDIVRFHVVVEREIPEPLAIFTADIDVVTDDEGMKQEEYTVTIPPEFLQAEAAYKFELLQIDANGNQTIAEDEFCTDADTILTEDCPEGEE